MCDAVLRIIIKTISAHYAVSCSILQRYAEPLNIGVILGGREGPDPPLFAVSWDGPPLSELTKSQILHSKRRK